MQITEQIIQRIARQVFNQMFPSSLRQSGAVISGSGSSVQYAVEAGHANSADNADTVDGFHATGLFRKIPNTRDINFADGNDKNGIIYINVNADGGTTDGFWTNYGSVLNLSHTAANWQFGVDAYDVLKFRSRWWSGGDHDWTDWKTVLLNVAGTVNVDGALTGITNLTMSGVIKIGNIYIGAQSDYIEIYKLDANNNKIAASLCAYGGLTALGVGSGGGGGGGSTTLAGLNDVTLTNLTGGQILVYNSTTSHWVNKSFAFADLTGSLSGAQLIAGINNLSVGDSDSTVDDYLIAQYAGGNGQNPANNNYYRRKISHVVNATVVKAALGTGIGTTRFLREDGTWQAVSVAWSNISSTPTTLSGYGITDAVASGTALLINGSNAMTGVLKVATANGIQNDGGQGLLCYKPTTWTGAATTTIEGVTVGKQWVLGAIDIQGVIRSSNNDLIHYRHVGSTGNINSIIIDTSNLGTYAIKTSSTEQTVASTISSMSKGIVEFYRSSGDHYAMIGFANAGGDGGTKQTLGFIGFKSGGQNQLAFRTADGANTYTIFHEGNFNKSHLSVSYEMPVSNTSGGKWHRLGNYKTAGNSSVFVIELYSGSGYNSNASQNSLARIIVKDGYQDTASATNSVGITVEQFANDFDVKAIAVATSDTEGALWVYLPHQHPSGVYTISGCYSSWAHNSSTNDDTTTEPTSNQRNTGYFAYLNRLAGGVVDGALVKTTGHLMMFGQVDNSSTSGTTQIVFGKREIVNNVVTDTQRVAISSNTNALIINPSTSDTNGQIILGVNGVGSTFGGNVGIGISSPQYRLQVDGQIYTNNSIHVVNSAAAVFVGTSTTKRISLHWASHNNNIRGLYDYTDAWLIGTDGNKSFLMKGNVGIGTDSPQYKLHVAGDIYATGGVTCLSDIRQKDVETYQWQPALSEIAEAPIARYQIKHDADDRMHVGSIAQYWKTVIPEAVREGSDGILSMDYGTISLISVIALAREVKRLKEEVERLKKN